MFNIVLSILCHYNVYFNSVDSVIYYKESRIFSQVLEKARMFLPRFLLLSLVSSSLAAQVRVLKSSKSGVNPYFNPFMPTVAFNICCPRDCVSRHNGAPSGAPLEPLRADSALRAPSSLRGLRRAPAAPPLCRETKSLGQQMLNATVGINGLSRSIQWSVMVRGVSEGPSTKPS